jgi:uncharacterized membrane protein YkoI
MKTFLAIVALLGAAAPAGVAQAQERAACARPAPLPAVLSAIGARTPGRHLNTSPGDAGGRSAYFVQWQLPDGRVVTFIVDACSGQIIGRQG